MGSKRILPPRLAIKCLRLFCSDQWVDQVLGDLLEQFEDDSKGKGAMSARVLFWLNVLAFVRPHFIKKQKRDKQILMINNYIKTSYRNLIKSKVYSIINLLGLSAGISSFLLISLYLNNELTYDSFFPDSDRIYRISLERVYPDRTRLFASSPVTLAPVLKDNYAEVESITRMHRVFFQNELMVTVGEDVFNETKFYFADKDFFKVFPYKFLYGSPGEALSDPANVVLTRSIAIKYFGEENVLGRTINQGGELIVTGVIEDLPKNTHIHFELLGSIHALGYLQNAIDTNAWINPWIYTYVKLKPGTGPENFQAKFDDLVRTFGAASISQQMGPDYESEGHKFNYFLQPIQDIHLHSNLDIEVEPNSNIQYVYLLSAIAIVILLISSINFINLSTARSSERAKEVGIRKVLGSYKSNLVYQFITESVMMSMAGSLLALAIVFYVLPSFNFILKKSLTMGFFLDPVIIAIFVVFIIFVGVVSGLYPALVISSLQPSSVLKGSFKTSNKGTFLRNSLIILQFAISIVMISGSIIVTQQMWFLKDKDLGFDKENTLVIRGFQALGNNVNAFKNEIRQLEEVIAVGSSQGVPGDFLGSNIFSSDEEGITDLRANTVNIDDDFFATIGFELLEGRAFNAEFNDSLNIILNESAVKDLGLENPVGKRIRSAGPRDQNPDFTIIGVVKDYNFYSLHSPITPLVIFNSSPRNNPPVMAIRIAGGDFQNTLNKLNKVWAEMATTGSIEFTFLDQYLENQYEADRASGIVFDIFTLIAIIMSCTGLFGLATYIVQQRTKEMSIRKVHGASLLNIVSTFSREFVKLILIAFILGVPLAYFLMDQWLTNFAYHVNISIVTFLLAALFAVVLVLITVSYQSIRVALLNPITSLRND
jgi:putative ABC transport system permease protein